MKRNTMKILRFDPNLGCQIPYMLHFFAVLTHGEICGFSKCSLLYLLVMKFICVNTHCSLHTGPTLPLKDKNPQTQPIKASQ